MAAVEAEGAMAVDEVVVETSAAEGAAVRADDKDDDNNKERFKLTSLMVANVVDEAMVGTIEVEEEVVECMEEAS